MFGGISGALALRGNAPPIVFYSDLYSYCAEMQVAIAVAEPVGCLVFADVVGDCGLVGWAPEPHLLGTTGCGPLCTGLGYIPPDGNVEEDGYPAGGVEV